MKSCEAGFAYLWTLFLVTFLGVGLTIGSEIYTTAAQRDREQVLIWVGHQFRNALGSYHNAKLEGGVNQYPDSLDDLLKDNRFAGTRRHLRKVYTDPITQQPEWGLVRIGGRIVGVHSLSDKMPIKQDNFEPAEAAFQGRERYSEWVFTYPPDLVLRQDGQGSGDPDQSGMVPETEAMNESER